MIIFVGAIGVLFMANLEKNTEKALLNL